MLLSPYNKWRSVLLKKCCPWEGPRARPGHPVWDHSIRSRAGSCVWSLSADVRRNGGPGRQRHISSGVPRWAAAAEYKLLTLVNFLLRENNRNGKVWVSAEVTRRRWNINEWEWVGSSQPVGHGSGINYQPTHPTGYLTGVKCSLKHWNVVRGTFVIVCGARGRTPVADSSYPP